MSPPGLFISANGGATRNADPGDRAFVATALRHGLTVVTADQKIHELVGVVEGFATVAS